MAKKSLFALLLAAITKAPAKPSRQVSPKATAPGRAKADRIEATGVFQFLDDYLSEDPDGVLRIDPEDLFAHDIVGESFCQDALAEIAGGKTPSGVMVKCEALLVPEANKHDRNAIAVMITGKRVGYLPKPEAKRWRDAMEHLGHKGRPVAVGAMIVGGWQADAPRKPSDSGSFGVKLDMDIMEDDEI